MSEALVQVAGELPPVLLAFDTDSPCVLDLEEAIREQGVPLRRVRADLIDDKLILGPLMLVFARCAAPGCFTCTGLTARPATQRCSVTRAHVWLKLFWKIAQKVGIKVVWTAGNISPDELASSDDVPAHYDLVSSRNAVMIRTETTACMAKKKFGANCADVGLRFIDPPVAFRFDQEGGGDLARVMLKAEVLDVDEWQREQECR